MNFINQYTKINASGSEIARSLALRPKTKGTDQKRTTFVTRYNPSPTKAMKIIHKYWPSLSKTKHLLFRSNKNLKSYLAG